MQTNHANEHDDGNDGPSVTLRAKTGRAVSQIVPLLLELEKKYDDDFGRNGSLLVGDKGIMTIGEFGDRCRLVPRQRAHLRELRLFGTAGRNRPAR